MKAWMCGAAVLTCALAAPLHALESMRRAVALGMFSVDPDHDYAGLLDEIAAQGATDVSLVVSWVQQDLRTTDINCRRGSCPSDQTVRRTIAEAKARGLRVLVFPILKIERRGKGEWRGKLKPTNAAAQRWWEAYTRFIMTQAHAAQDAGAYSLSVGSELLALENDRARWAELIGRVRSVYRGRLTYSANWDHFSAVSFWDLLDDVSLTAYYELSKKDGPTVADLAAAWQRWTPQLEAFSRKVGKPLILSEVGYPSLHGSSRYPWDETRRAPVDLEEQRRCYQAFLTTVADQPYVGGVYFWNWWGVGGATDGDYTPRGKPAGALMRAWFQRAASGDEVSPRGGG